MSINQNFPEIRPSLNLNFARSKTLDPRITFTRASIATYVDEDGLIKTASADEARFDHDPVTGESLGLLIEEERTNLQFPSIPIIAKSGATVTANAATAPDGTNTATFVEPDGSTNCGVNSGSAIAKTAGQTYVHSFFYKPNGYNVCGIYYSSGNPDRYAEAYIDVTNPTSSFVDTTFTSISVKGIGLGWYLIKAVQSITDGGTSYGWGKRLTCRPYVPTSNNDSFTHTSGSGGYFWGHQEELGTFPTSYIPTTSSTVTREADVAKITGTNFTDFYNQSEGTVFIKTKVDRTVDEGGTSLWYIGSDNRCFYRASGDIGTNTATQSLTFFNTDGVTTFTKTAIAIKANDHAGSNSNDILRTAPGSPTSASGSSFLIGHATSSLPYLNGHISRLTYYPERLTNAQLQTLTK